MSDAALHDDNEEDALDFDSLRRHGIELIQRMAGDVWTDFNLHDPGVTILEALCYALTDLAYQTDFDITDLLADEDGTINYEANSFYVKQNILTSNPVTATDYRKALIDEVKEIDNVWLTPLTSGNGTNAIRGLYKIIVQVNKTFARQWLAGEADVQTIKTKILTAYNSKRNLCEDVFDAITVLKPVEVSVRADIQIEPNQVPEQILAKIYLALESAINQPIRHFTELEMTSRGYTIDEMYCGPYLKNGFILDKDLSQRRLTVDTANIIQVISGVSGVVLVKSLLIQKNGDEPSKVLMLDESEFAFLNIDNLSSISINLFVDRYRMPPIRKTMFADMLQKVIENEYRDFVTSFYQSSSQLTGTYRDTSQYYSIQNYFPLVYGIGEEGLYTSASEERKAQAKQLKGYLMLFEQVLANYQTQLDNIDTFFSNDLTRADNQTYFANTLYNVPRVIDILKAYTDKQVGFNTEVSWEKFKNDKNNVYVKALSNTIESDADFEDRKNRILDHLLARFNEFGVVYPVKLFNLLYRNDQPGGRVSIEIRWKASLLKDFYKINYNRARAFDYLNNNDNVYHFETKMRKLLYINSDPKAPLTSVFDAAKVKFNKVDRRNPAPKQDINDDTDWSPDLQKIVLSKKDLINLIDSGLLAGAESNDNSSFVFRHQDISVLRHAININNYRIGPDPFADGDNLILYKESTAERWNILSRLQNGGVPAISTIKKLVNYLTQLSIQSEGFYLVEHILLRPDLHSRSYGFRLYKSETEIIFEHNQLLTFTEREAIIDRILNFKPNDHFYLSHQNALLTLANKQLHHAKWTDKASEFIKKADSLLRQAAHLVVRATELAENATPDNKAFAAQNKFIAQQNEIIAALNQDIAEQFLAIQNKSKSETGIILSYADKADLEKELNKAIDGYYADVEDVLDKVSNLERRIGLQAEMLNHAILGELAQMGKMVMHTGNTFNDVIELYNTVKQYGQQIFPRFKMLVSVKDGQLISEDFFSFNMTVIFPEWPARFQDKSFRACAEGLFKHHAPAHISLHVKWFNLNKMKRFEPLFFDWKKSLQTGRQNIDASGLIAFLADHPDSAHPI